MATKELFFSWMVLIALIGSGTDLWGQTAGFAYVTNCGGYRCQGGEPGNVSAYSIDGTTGALTTVAGSPFPAGNNPVSLAVDPTGQFAYVATINGDGVPDLAVTYLGTEPPLSTDGGVSVLLGSEDGTFQAARNFGAGNSPDSVVVGDFNSDGVPDLAVVLAQSPSPPATSIVRDCPIWL